MFEFEVKEISHVIFNEVRVFFIFTSVFSVLTKPSLTVTLSRLSRAGLDIIRM